jgi:hypothetical protein
VERQPVTGNWQRLAAITLFAAITIASLEPTLLGLPFRDCSRLRSSMERAADRAWYPGYPRFLEGVRAHTVNGQSIALVVPAKRWELGYMYAYYRASYILAGREVLPIVGPDDRTIAENVRRAPMLAAWGVDARGGRVVWRGEGGVLLQR